MEKPKPKRATRKTARDIVAIGTDARGHKVGIREDGTLATGRLPLYSSEEHDQKVIELGKQGYGKAEMAFELGITRETLDNWMRKYPTFSDAIAWALTAAQAWWEAEGRKGIKVPTKFFNAAHYNFIMRTRYRRDYAEGQGIPQLPPGELPPDRGPDPEAYSDEELAALLRAEAAKRRAAQS